MLEVELNKNQRLVDELLVKPESVASNGSSSVTQNMAVVGGNFAKLKKLESHLTLNLKRRVKDLQGELQQKSADLDQLKRSIKTTKQQEMEVEVRQYMDECNRLRVQLEEVIKSKDTFADPEELKLIEDRFAAQEQVINGLRVENSALITTINNKDDEIRTLRELFSEQSKR